MMKRHEHSPIKFMRLLLISKPIGPVWLNSLHYGIVPATTLAKGENWN